MSNMKLFSSERGALNALLIPLVLAVVFLLGTLGFGAWAFTSRQDYKDHSDQKSAEAVAIAVQQANTAKDNQFAEDEKKPLRTFTGPDSLGGISFQYPKTWSVYEEDTPNTLSLTLHPNYIPGADSTAYALRIELVNNAYEKVVAGYDGPVNDGDITAAAYSLPKIPSILGVRFDGEVADGKQGAMITVPLRDKTIQIWTEAPQYVNDFNTLILPNFTFKP
jgi:hypothetical protein